MSDYVTVQLKGLARLTGQMTRFQEEMLEQTLPAALAELGESGRELMAAGAPKFSGLLKSSFESKVSVKEKHVVKVFIGPNTKTVYPPGHDKHGLGKTMTAFLVAGWIEFGHRLADGYSEADYTKSGRLKKRARRRAHGAGKGRGEWVPAIPFMRNVRDKIAKVALLFVTKKVKEMMEKYDAGTYGS